MDYGQATKMNRMIKAQRSNTQYLESSLRLIEGSGLRGAKQRPFNYEVAVNEFKSWVFSAVSLNMNAVASLPLRLFVNVPQGRKLRHFNTRKISHKAKAYLDGRIDGTYGKIGPAKQVHRKAIEFGDDFEEVVSDHPVLDLIKTVNPWFNGFDLIQLTTIYLELTGNSYWHPVIGPNDVPAEIWPMPSQWVWVKPDRENFIDGYLYGRDPSMSKFFDRDEVIHFRTANPGRDGLFYGKGKVESGWSVIALNNSNHDMDLAFSDNNARPDYVAMVKGASGPALDRFEKKVESKLRGVRESGKFMALQGDMELTPLNFPPKDLMGRDDTVEEIAAVFGVPVSMLKANDPNLASSKTGYAQWREATILPITKLIEQKLNEQLLPLFGLEQNAVLAFDNPVPADKEFELREAVGLVSAGINTRDEKRIERGDEPRGGGADELLVTAGLVPVDDAGQLQQGGGGGGVFGLPSRAVAATPKAPSEDGVAQAAASAVAEAMKGFGEEIRKVIKEAVVDEAGKLVPAVKKDDGPSGGVWVPPEFSDYVKARIQRKFIVINQSDHIYCIKHLDQDPEHPMHYKVDASQDVREEQPATPEQEMERAIAEVLQQSEQRILDRAVKTAKGKFRVKVTNAGVQAAIDELRKLNNDLVAAIEKPLTEMVRAGAEGGTQRLLDMTGLPDDFASAIEGGLDVTNPEVAKILEAQTIRLAGEISTSTIDSVRSTLLDGIDQGLSPLEIAENIQGTGMFTPARAQAIARTESANAFVEGEKQSWRSSGVVEGVEWLLAPNACEFCKAVAANFQGVIQPLDEPFVKLGDTVVGTDGGTLNINFRPITGPPLHPNDRCDLVPVLKDLGA